MYTIIDVTNLIRPNVSMGFIMTAIETFVAINTIILVRVQ